MARASRNKKTIHRLRPQGEITIYNAADMKTILLDTLQVHNKIEIDLAEVSELDTAGVQLLVLARREADKADKSLSLITPSEVVQEMLNLYHLTSYFDSPDTATSKAG